VRSPISDEVNRPQNEPDNAGQGLLERAFARENLKRAWKRVKTNKGAAGVDGLDIEQTAEHLLTQWVAIREQLLSGVYRPSPVRRVVIPKPDGGQRELGIPTVTDRLIQQALLQVLQPLLDPTFSEHSYGFRPGRCAQDAVLAAQRHVSSGRKVVVDVDLEKFFDRVDHDILMDRLRKRIADRAVIRLIRAYLDAGTLINGVIEKSRCGAPQGGPLPPGGLSFREMARRTSRPYGVTNEATQSEVDQSRHHSIPHSAYVARNDRTLLEESNVHVDPRAHRDRSTC
jgi:retron-type reverse transcriptase